MYSVQEAMQSPVFLAGFLQRCATGNQVEWSPLPPSPTSLSGAVNTSKFPVLLSTRLTSSQKTVHRRGQ